MEKEKIRFEIEEELVIAEAVRRFKKSYVDFHLKKFKGNISHTAKAIGTGRMAIYRVIEDDVEGVSV